MDWRKYVKPIPRKGSPKKNVMAKVDPDLQVWFGQMCGEAGAPVASVLNAMLRSVKESQSPQEQQQGAFR